MQRRDCIKHALEAEGMPKTVNVHEVVTENFLCTGGLSPYRNDITCKGMLHSYSETEQQLYILVM